MISTYIPAVTICIPTFNQAPFLLQAIESALNQSHTNVRIFISDDASTDNTAELMRKYEGHKQIQYFRQPLNLGISANNNWLLSQPDTEYIIRLDSDDLLLPEYTTTLLDLFLQYPDAGYAHAAVNEIDAQNTLRRVRRLFGRSEYQDAVSALKAGISGYRVAANICMFKRSVLHEMNFYKPGMNFCEDWELSVRIADAGYGNIYYPAPLACYRVWTDQGNVRASRKLTEINGGLDLYNNTYIPAFMKRKWDPAVIEKQKNTYALNHSVCLTQSNFTNENKEDIKKLLFQLTRSNALKIRIWMIETGLFWMIQIPQFFKIKMKDLIKNIINRNK
ncbi:MAG: glycosyltransferase family 2 protein [Cytophagales bacterium]|nr:glycosyltransferase family 2 protein [Cytophaga sp.]